MILLLHLRFGFYSLWSKLWFYVSLVSRDLFKKKKKFNGYKLTIIEKGIWTLVLLIININIYYWTRKLFFFLFFFTLFDCVGDIGLAWLCFYKLLELINCVNIFKYQLEKDRKYAGQELESFVNNLGIPFLKLHQE